MGYYFKQIGFTVIYIVLAGFIAFCITYINNVFIDMILFAFNIFLMGFILFSSFYRDGKEAYKTLEANDNERRHIAETGDLILLNKHAEYAWYKGFLVGLITCAPIIICFIIHLILSLTSGVNGAGIAGSILGFATYGIVYTFKGLYTASAFYYITLSIVPLISVICGVGYLMGARKYYLQVEALKDMHYVNSGDRDL